MITIHQNSEGEWVIWTVPDGGDIPDGRCVGVGKTKREALVDAREELLSDIGQLWKLAVTEII